MPSDPDLGAVRAEMLERWGRAAAGWGKRALRVREFGLPVSAWMLDHVGLQPGFRVLELAAGPGETGFLAAELIRPGGSLVCSDATEEMLEVARARASELGIENVEFKRIELEWIDLETASVDVVLCKWGLMFAVDPEAALREIRRVLRPGWGSRARRLGRASGEPVGDDHDARAGRARAHHAARSRRAGHVRAGAARAPAGSAPRRRIPRSGGRVGRAAARI